VLAQLQAAVVIFQQQVNASLLSAAKITNPASQQSVLNAINAVGTVVLAMLALVQSVSSKVAVARMASQSTIATSHGAPYNGESKLLRWWIERPSAPPQLAGD